MPSTTIIYSHLQWDGVCALERSSSSPLLLCSTHQLRIHSSCPMMSTLSGKINKCCHGDESKEKCVLTFALCRYLKSFNTRLRTLLNEGKYCSAHSMFGNKCVMKPLRPFICSTWSLTEPCLSSWTAIDVKYCKVHGKGVTRE